MKQKAPDNDFVTKKILSETLRYYPTEEECKEAEKKLRNELLQSQENSKTRLDKDFIDRLAKSQAASRAESDYKFSLMRADLRNEISQFADRILTAIDPLLQELETRQQDREISTAQFADHERRITKLEHT